MSNATCSNALSALQSLRNAVIGRKATASPACVRPKVRPKTRLQKFLAEAGVASRRSGEALITSGRIQVNGKPVTTLGARIDPESDRVTFDGTLVRPRRKLYVALHKPAGYLSTRRDPRSRRTVAELLPKEWEELYPVGRLDYDTEGLLFLTNDGDFCLHLTHPRYGIPKVYLTEVEGPLPIERLTEMTRGVEDAGERLRADAARLLRSDNIRSVIELVLREGKNREVRRLMAALGLKVLHLRRIQIGPIKLGELPSGRWRVLTSREISALLATSQPAAGKTPD
jgi:23S rRNA pseudouridine2605 synthase